MKGKRLVNNCRLRGLSVQVCFLDNGLSEKCAAGPEGHFSDYWGFGITDCQKTIEWL